MLPLLTVNTHVPRTPGSESKSPCQPHLSHVMPAVGCLVAHHSQTPGWDSACPQLTDSSRCKPRKAPQFQKHSQPNLDSHLPAKIKVSSIPSFHDGTDVHPATGLATLLYATLQVPKPEQPPRPCLLLRRGSPFRLPALGRRLF